MALHRQGSGSVQVDRAAFRAQAHGNGGIRHKLNRGRRFSRLPGIPQCSVAVFVLILFTVFIITIVGSNYPFSDRGEHQTSSGGEFYDEGRSSHFSFWNSGRQEHTLREKNENKGISDAKDVPELMGKRKNNDDKGSNQISKVLHFGHGSVGSGRDSRYWDRDDRRRDEDYDGEDSPFSNTDSHSGTKNIGLNKVEKNNMGNGFDDHGRDGVRKEKPVKGNTVSKHVTYQEGHAKLSRKPDWKDFGNGGLYNEKGRDELKSYEAQYEEDLRHELDFSGTGKEDGANGLDKEHEKVGIEGEEDDAKHRSMDKKIKGSLHTKGFSNQQQVDLDDEYDDGIDEDFIRPEETEDISNEQNIVGAAEKLTENVQPDMKYSHKTNPDLYKASLDFTEHNEGRKRVLDSHFEKESTLLLRGFHQDKLKGTLVSNPELMDSSRKAGIDKRKTSSMRRTKRRKHASASCEPRFLNSTSQLAEPEEIPKFAKFSLQYVEREEKPDGVDDWEPRFAGHQSLEEREASFYAHDQKLKCGFIKGPKGSPSTGFDLSEMDAAFLNTCHIAVSSCIFGNSDNLRTPTGKKVTQSSKKHVCFVMFVDETTLETMSSEGRQPDENGYIGLWKIVVVRNLPYTDMRRTGKVPKFLTHRLFPSARYSIWLDSKLRLQSDPLLILEYFLWRRHFEYAISNHYDRHCVWEEVMQNKRLNKFNHTIIDEQFAFYQSDGLTRFNASDPNKLLPSYVPEGSFIVRAHTPMSNLFSCLWFNEVNRFTPRDQLSFAYTYMKFRRMNPEKHFYLNMFKDCERRQMAKLFHHRTDEKPSNGSSASL